MAAQWLAIFKGFICVVTVLRMFPRLQIVFPDGCVGICDESEFTIIMYVVLPMISTTNIVDIKCRKDDFMCEMSFSYRIDWPTSFKSRNKA
jgi:hypothetical protein